MKDLKENLVEPGKSEAKPKSRNDFLQCPKCKQYSKIDVSRHIYLTEKRLGYRCQECHHIWEGAKIHSDGDARSYWDDDTPADNKVENKEHKVGDWAKFAMIIPFEMFATKEETVKGCIENLFEHIDVKGIIESEAGWLWDDAFKKGEIK